MDTDGEGNLTQRHGGGRRNVKRDGRSGQGNKRTTPLTATFLANAIIQVDGLSAGLVPIEEFVGIIPYPAHHLGDILVKSFDDNFRLGITRGFDGIFKHLLYIRIRIKVNA